MGIFDAFTGKAGRDAADRNIANLLAAKTEGLGYLDTGRTNALGALDSAKDYYDPLTGLATKYGKGSELYLDALGINGPDGNTRATSAFQSAPGYDFKVNSALDALDRRAASRGMLASGNTTLDTLSTVTGLADQGYSDWLNRLQGVDSNALSATGAAAGGLAGLEAGKAPVWTNDANSRVNLTTGIANGINSQETQAANAAMQGSANLWNFGLNAAKLGTGFLGGKA